MVDPCLLFLAGFQHRWYETLLGPTARHDRVLLGEKGQSNHVIYTSGGFTQSLSIDIVDPTIPCCRRRSCQCDATGHGILDAHHNQ